MLRTKKCICCLILLVTVMVGLSCFAMEDSPKYIYVSTEGDDRNSGTADMPLKSLHGAIAKVNGMPKSSDIHVVFCEGRYEFDKSAEFTKAAAGNAKCNIYYEAAEGASVEFTGSRLLDVKKFVPVADESILERLPKDAADKVVCMQLKDQGIESINGCNFKRSANVVSEEYVSLFYNGKKEMISQWPNGENNYAVFGDVISNRTFRFSQTNPLRWKEADQMYIGGYMGRDYAFERAEVESIDAEESTITLSPTMTFGVLSVCAKRWQAFNLLEEIDIPGEWFIDLNTMLLYYYPHDNFKEGDTLEISYFDEPFLHFGSTDVDFYTSFKGITFTKSRGAIMSGGGNHITLDDCTVSYIDANAINLSGINNRFENSRFIYIGGYAFRIMNYGKIYKSNETVLIKNNYFTKCGTYLTTALPAMTMSTHNFVLENNMFHNQYGGVASLGWDTAEAKVRYNEVYNCERELSDAGIFYCGNYYGDPGNEIAYNLIYDYKSKSKILQDASVMGIYMDDIYSGAYIHHNILVDGGFGGIQIGGGHNNRVENNIVLDMIHEPIYTDNRGELWTSFNKQTFAGQAVSALNKEGFAKKYPWLIDGVKNTLLPIHCTFINNISDKAIIINDRMKELGTVKGNIKINSYDDFVNPEKYDFRIKNGSRLAGLCPDALNENNFSMDMIGVKGSVIENIDKKYTTFEKLWPKDGEKDVQASGLMLTWQEAIFADEYRVVLASNSEMTDVIAEITAPYAFCDISDYVEAGEKTYYWTVQAVNRSVNYADKWYSADGASSFTTSLYDALNRDEFDLIINKTRKLLNAVSPEIYYESAIEQCRAALRETVNYTELPEDGITRTESKQVLSKLEYAIETLKKSRIVEEEIWKDEQFSASYWNLTEGVNVSEKDKEIIFSTPSSGGDVTMKELPSDDVLLTFDMKVDFNPDTNGWLGLEMYRNDLTKAVWSDSGYLIVIKKDQSEVQKYPGGLIDTVISDVFADGNFHKVSIGVVKEVGNSKFIFKVDDTPFFEYTDFTPFKESGYFNFRMFQGGTVSIRQHETEKIQEDGGLWHDALYTKTFTVNSPSCKLTGNWNESSDGNGVKISSDVSASATYDVDMGAGTFALFYRKPEVADGDEKAKYSITADYVSGREGDEKQYNGVIDFTSSQDEWEYMGCYDDVMNGMTLRVNLATGGKCIAAGAVKTVRVEGAYKALANLMNTDAHICIMKTGSNIVYFGQERLSIDKAPEAADDAVMLPLRAAAELFGYTVSWNAEEKKALVKSSDGNVIEFAESDTVYISNGKMMIDTKFFEKIFKKRILTNENDVVAIGEADMPIELSPELERLFY
ncbi:MAG: right-handed parallel beta-helix repeat-containing protein [Clostridia bacterium]|nr:right-handed parallel beta-helix repeat-containing protein [Clostridia bacterium]